MAIQGDVRSLGHPTSKHRLANRLLALVIRPHSWVFIGPPCLMLLMTSLLANQGHRHISLKRPSPFLIGQQGVFSVPSQNLHQFPTSFQPLHFSVNTAIKNFQLPLVIVSLGIHLNVKQRESTFQYYHENELP